MRVKIPVFGTDFFFDVFLKKGSEDKFSWAILKSDLEGEIITYHED